MKRIFLLIAAAALLMGAFSCSDDDEPRRGNGIITVNTPMINHIVDVTSGQPMGISSTHNKLTLDTAKHKASLELNYNDWQGDKMLELSDIIATPKRLGFYVLSSPSNNTFSGYVDFNESSMRYCYTSNGVRIISFTPEVFFLKTKSVITYDDTTKSNTTENTWYHFTIEPATSAAIVTVSDIVHVKDLKNFDHITAYGVAVTVTSDGFVVAGENLKTEAKYIAFDESTGSSFKTTTAYPFKTFNATIDLVNDTLNANYMLGNSATIVATGRTYPNYTTY